jgi:hypothetical protein
MEKHEKDIAWLKKGFSFKHGVEPTETKVDSFVEKVAVFCSEGQDELTARRMAFKILDF